MSQEIIVDPALDRLRSLVARAREQLSDAQAEYMREKSRVAAIQAELFQLLREEYERRDTLRLLVRSREAQLEALRRKAPQEAAGIDAAFSEQRARIHEEYEATASDLAGRRKLEPEQKSEIARLWKKLVKLYHPDRYATEPDKLETYHCLTAVINRAKEAGDLETLRQIADDPHGFITRRGWADLDLGDTEELAQLERLHAALLVELTAALDLLAALRESPGFKLCLHCDLVPDGLAQIASTQRAQISSECATLESEAEALVATIENERNGSAG